MNGNDINNFDLLLLSIKENVTSILIIWFLGCTIVGGIFIYLAIIYKGFSIGYTISAIIAVLGVKQGVIVALSSLVLQNIIFEYLKELRDCGVKGLRFDAAKHIGLPNDGVDFFKNGQNTGYLMKTVIINKKCPKLEVNLILGFLISLKKIIQSYIA